MNIKLLEKYNIVTINGKRYYKEDLTKRDFIVECAVPYCFKYEDIEIYESAWTRMLTSVLKVIDAKNPKRSDELLKIENDWGKQKVFYEKEQSNTIEFKGIYFNLNHSAVHSLWTLQLLLKVYGIPLGQCELYLRRPPYAEPEDVRIAVKEDVINAFKEHLEGKGLATSKIEAVIKVIEVLNVTLKKTSKSYTDFFLFDDNNVFCNYRKKVIDDLANRVDSKKLNIFKTSINYLDDFYKERRKRVGD